jgi:hypothetical protein
MVKSSERRDGPRIDLRLRVRYEAGDPTLSVAGEAEASDVSPKGLRLESDKAVEKGTALKLHVDAGEVEELEATGYVTWCRPRASPTGKTVYDLGVAFESDWLAKDRGPLGSALARIFAMNSYEPARNFERTPVSLNASSVSPALELEIGNLSIGGMQIRSKGPLGDHMRAGLGVRVEIEAEGSKRTLPGKVAWVAGNRGDPGEYTGPRVSDSFGVEFATTISPEDRALLEKIRTGQTEPTRIVLALDS